MSTMASVNPLSFTFALFFIYLALLLVCLFQIARIIWNKHNLLSWQFGFLIQCLFWAMLRCVYFLMIDYFDKLINAGLPVFIFWIAVNIQFSTFSLLVLFYASIDARSNKVWYQRRKIFCFIYIVVNLIFLSCTIATTIVMSVIGRKEDLKSSGKWETKSLNTLTAVIFCFLVTILAFYGWKVYLLMKKGQIQIPFQPQRTSPIYVIAVTVLMFFLFTTRAVYNVLAAFGVISLAVESGFAWQDGIVFMLFFVWEIIPASLVILLFWRIPSSSVYRARLASVTSTRRGIINEPLGPDESPLQHPTVRSSLLFDNPQRYDSDEEAPPTTNYSPSPRFFVGENSPYSPYNTTPPTYGSTGSSTSG